jgi:hypothetical protein
MAGMIVSFVGRDSASQRLMHQVGFLADLPLQTGHPEPASPELPLAFFVEANGTESPDQEAGLKSLMSCC